MPPTLRVLCESVAAVALLFSKRESLRSHYGSRVVAPLAAPGAPTPTIVTISGTVLGNNLAITFHATDPFVTNYRTLPFVFSAAAPGVGPQTASVPMRMAICTWGGRLTLNDHGTRIHAPTVSGLGFNVTYTCAAFSLFLTELAASGLLNAGPL